MRKDSIDDDSASPAQLAGRWVAPRLAFVIVAGILSTTTLIMWSESRERAHEDSEVRAKREVELAEKWVRGTLLPDSKRKVDGEPGAKSLFEAVVKDLTQIRSLVIGASSPQPSELTSLVCNTSADFNAVKSDRTTHITYKWKDKGSDDGEVVYGFAGFVMGSNLLCNTAKLRNDVPALYSGAEEILNIFVTFRQNMLPNFGSTETVGKDTLLAYGDFLKNRWLSSDPTQAKEIAERLIPRSYFIADSSGNFVVYPAIVTDKLINQNRTANYMPQFRPYFYSAHPEKFYDHPSEQIVETPEYKAGLSTIYVDFEVSRPVRTAWLGFNMHNVKYVVGLDFEFRSLPVGAPEPTSDRALLGGLGLETLGWLSILVVAVILGAAGGLVASAAAASLASRDPDLSHKIGGQILPPSEVPPAVNSRLLSLLDEVRDQYRNLSHGELPFAEHRTVNDVFAGWQQLRRLIEPSDRVDIVIGCTGFLNSAWEGLAGGDSAFPPDLKKRFVESLLPIGQQSYVYFSAPDSKNWDEFRKKYHQPVENMKCAFKEAGGNGRYVSQSIDVPQRRSRNGGNIQLTYHFVVRVQMQGKRAPGSVFVFWSHQAEPDFFVTTLGWSAEFCEDADEIIQKLTKAAPL